MTDPLDIIAKIVDGVDDGRNSEDGPLTRIMKVIGLDDTNTILWNSMRRDPIDGRAFMVAVDSDGYRFIADGRIKRGKISAVGCSVRPYAWAYYPQPPNDEDIK